MKNYYKVIAWPWASDTWAIVLIDQEDPRPVGEILYSDVNNAHRRKRKLNKDAQKIDTMIARDGAIII